MDEKVAYSQKNGELIVSISGRVEPWKETLLFCWILAWTFCGFYVFSQLFADYPREARLAMFIYLAFWLYFEIRIGKAFLWRRWGRELIKVDHELLMIKKDIRSYGKVRSYYLENIKDLRLHVVDPGSMAAAFYQSFWVVGQETLSFEYLGKKVKFGGQLQKGEAEKLYNKLGNRIKMKA